MKNLFFLSILTLFISSKSFSQDQNFEKTVCYKLKDNAAFFSVDKRYQIQSDTVYLTDSGFLINRPIDTVTINNTLYCIITYPPFNNGKQHTPDTTRDIATRNLKNSFHLPLKNINGLWLCIPKKSFDAIPKDTLYSTSLLDGNNWHPSTGQLTIPFKLRPSLKGKSFEMTTDVTLGAYGGVKKRISKAKPNYVTIPLVLGITFVNVNDNSTVTTNGSNVTTGVYPGFTIASGLVFQFGSKINLGFVFGRDYASSVGSSWIYNNKTWYSFAIGYSFLK